MFALTDIKTEFLSELEFLCAFHSKVFLYPFKGMSKLKTFGYYIFFFFLLLTTTQLIYTLCVFGFVDILELINIAPNIGACLMTTIRYIKFRKHNVFYEKTFNHFNEDVWDIVPECSTKNLQTVSKYLRVSKYVNRFFVYYSFPLILLVNSAPYILMTYENNNSSDIRYYYPFDGWYPFDKVKWFYTAYAWESLMTGLVVIIYACSDMTNVSFIIYICMELKLLGNCLEDLITGEDVADITKRKNTRDVHKNIKRKLKNIIKKLDYLKNTASELNDILGDVMLINYAFGSVFICLTAFTFTVVDDLNRSLRYFFFFLSLLISMFNQCKIGQILADHSVAISDAVYSSNWPCADVETKKLMLILMMRMQQPFELTAKGYIVINLNTFTEICSSSYQLFNLLRTVY